MQEILSLVFSFPTVVFTTLLGICLVYWAMVFVGFLDIDIGGTEGLAEGAEGATEGLLEGAAESAVDGALEGAAEGALEGATEGALEGAAEGAAEGAEGALDGVSGGEGFLSWLGVGTVPITVIISFFVLAAWATSMLGAGYLLPLLPVPAIVGQLGLLAASLVVAAPFTRISARPFAPIFKTHLADNNRDLVGRACIIRTGTVDERFGQALVAEGGSDALINVRARSGNGLGRGDEALIVSYNSEAGAFVVEAMTPSAADEQAAANRNRPRQPQGVKTGL